MLTTFHFHDHAQPRGFRRALLAAVICCAVSPERAAALGVAADAVCCAVDIDCDATTPTGAVAPSQETFHTTGTIPEPTASTYFCARAQRASVRVVQLPLSGGLAKTMTAGGVRGNATGPWVDHGGPGRSALPFNAEARGEL